MSTIKTYERAKNNLLSVRFTPVLSGYLDALDEYEQASQRAPDNPDYRTSKEKLLMRLGKANQARLSQNPKSRYPMVSWFFWMLPFLVLPTLVNTGIGALLLAVWHHSEMWMGVALGTFCISIFGAVVVNLNDKPYHLYKASLLLYPISCFTIGSLILVVGVGILIGVVWFFHEISQAYKAAQEQQKIAAQKAKAASSKKAASRQGLLPKASPASPRNFKNSSSRVGKSVKKPILSSTSKGVSPKQANRPKKPIARKKPSNRQIYRK